MLSLYCDTRLPSEPEHQKAIPVNTAPVILKKEEKKERKKKVYFYPFLKSFDRIHRERERRFEQQGPYLERRNNSS